MSNRKNVECRIVLKMRMMFKFSWFFCLVLVIACSKTDFLPRFDAIPADNYFDADILSDHSEIYGKWEVIGTSGGFAGTGYPIDFDELHIKPNAIFGIVRNDSLLTTGKIDLVDNQSVDLAINFVPEDDPNELMIQLMYDTEKFVIFQSDSMSLNSFCCDRFDTHLLRKD